MKPIRKTTQVPMPAYRPAPGHGYDLYPTFPLGASVIELGFEALAAKLENHARVMIDGIAGVIWQDFQEQLNNALKSQDFVDGQFRV